MPESKELVPNQRDPQIARVLKENLMHCFLGGLCPLIPIPFVDEWAVDYVQREMLQRIAARHAIKLSKSHAKFLSEGYKEEVSCLLNILMLPMNLLVNLVLKPSKKLLRKITIVLMVKESADMLSLFVHQAILTDYSAAQGLLANPADQVETQKFSDEKEKRQLLRSKQEEYKKQLFKIAKVVNKTCAQTDTRILNQSLKRILSSSKLLILISYTAFVKWIKQARKAFKKGEEFQQEFDSNIAADNEKLADFIDQIYADLMLREGYFTQLVQKYEQNFADLEQAS